MTSHPSLVSFQVFIDGHLWHQMNVIETEMPITKGRWRWYAAWRLAKIHTAIPRMHTCIRSCQQQLPTPILQANKANNHKITTLDQQLHYSEHYNKYLQKVMKLCPYQLGPSLHFGWDRLLSAQHSPNLTHTRLCDAFKGFGESGIV